MKDNKVKKYIILIAFLFGILIFLELNKKEPVDWTPTFSNVDKNPYGTYICYDMLRKVFPTGVISESRYPITNELYYVDEDEIYVEDQYFDADTAEVKVTTDRWIENLSYIFICDNFGSKHFQSNTLEVSKLDLKNLLMFVEEGNNAFISAEQMTPLLLDTLNIKIEKDWSTTDTVYIFNDLNKGEYAFSGASNRLNFFKVADTCKFEVRVLAKTKRDGKPVFLKVKFGEGYIYLHSIPAAFSNYILLRPKQHHFAFTCLSYLPKNDSVVWDEYLKQGRVGEHSIFRVIWNNDSLLYAYYILFFTILLFILFRAKRTQRIIPVIESPKNTSIEFLNTLSNLYYQKEAYESVVEKRHYYFLETIRTRYYLPTESINEEFITNLNLKSGVEINLIREIFELHKEIHHLYYVSNTLLLKYNEKLESFYRKMK